MSRTSLLLAAAFLAGCGGGPPRATAAAAAAAQAPSGATATASAQRAATSDGAARAIFVFIGDGAGVASWSAAKFAADRLAVARMPVMGLVDSRNATLDITDSAAGATVYATGVRTYNGAIGVDVDRQPLRTILEVAEDRGMSTGLVATSSITHATPASFAAHVPDRGMAGEIARQYAAQDIEVLLGGGLQYFDGSGDDASDLLPALSDRYTVVRNAAVLWNAAADAERLLGLFAEDGMDPAIEGRAPTLDAMTSAALAVVAKDDDGFLLVIEGSQPDWRQHGNESLESVAAEMLDLDAAIGVALDYLADNPQTLIVVTADHETGGLALEREDGRDVADYTTGSHSNEMVPLFAAGAGAAAFAGINDNAEIGRLLMRAVGGEAP
ncbi:MAG: alkaline phosphatase [Gemmatimonadota bacterium]